MEIEGVTVGAVDLACGGIVLVSAFFAFVRGFVREALAIAGWVGAGAIAWAYHPVAMPYLQPYINNETVLAFAAGIGLFVVLLGVFWLIIHMVVARVKASPLNALDRSLGFLFGVARGVVVIALMFLLGKYSLWNQTGEEEPEWLTGAASYTLIQYSAAMIERAVPLDLLPAALDPDGVPGAGDLLDGDAEAERVAQPPVAAPAGGEPVYEDDPSRLFDHALDDVDDTGGEPDRG